MNARATVSLAPSLGLVDDAWPEFAALRHREYARLDRQGHAYLDYTGSGLYGASQVRANGERLLGDVFGNPHSANPTSMLSTARMERARSRVLEFLHADPDRYDLVFTANASAALKIVGESFPFEAGSRFVLTRDNHNSVNGIRRFAIRAKAEVGYVPLGSDLRCTDPEPWLRNAPKECSHLFAFPAQSNFSGVRHPLEWIARAKSLGFSVLLDAAAYVPTASLRLDRVQPDFVCLSFYKMFGFPTGIGALVVLREALARLQRPWFAGGTVEWVATEWDEQLLSRGAAGFEDGTPHFLAFDAVCDGLDLLESIGMMRISERTAELTAYLLGQLQQLRHPNGLPLLEIHGPRDTVNRGATVPFNVLDTRGKKIPHDRVVEAAGNEGVSLRGGCFCNPGCAEAALGFSTERARSCRNALGRDYTHERFGECMGDATGAVRASLGVPTLERDIDRLVLVLRRFRGCDLSRLTN